jgi:hypothetical protein
VTRWRREPRAKRVELMVQVLAGHLALADQPAAVADGVKERIEGPALRRPSAALAGERDQGGAVAVVVLETARAKLGAGCLGL